MGLSSLNEYSVFSTQKIVSAADDVNKITNNKTLSSVHLTPDGMSREKSCEADIIKRFIRKVIAAKSYSLMFSKGKDFAQYEFRKQKNPGQSIMDSHALLDRISKNNIESIKKKTQNLTYQEKVLLSKIVDVKLKLRHQSDSLLAKNGVLSIFSNSKLTKDKIDFVSATQEGDIAEISNHDFVFFGIEFIGENSIHPIRKHHHGIYFGENTYLLDNEYKHGYLTLTDHYHNMMRPFELLDHRHVLNQLPKVYSEITRNVRGDGGLCDIPIYNAKDMKLALGLHLIEFVRNSKDVEFKTYSLNGDLDEVALDELIHFVFQPEFHLPRMVSTERFNEVKDRDQELTEAIGYLDIEKIQKIILTKDDAIKAMLYAVMNSKKTLVNDLILQWNIDISDKPKMKILSFKSDKVYIDIEYLLSAIPENTEILKYFIDSNLIDVNKECENLSHGKTMLDNAIENKCNETIELLTNYQALTGEEVRKRRP